MLKSEDFIRLGSNLIDNNGENNIKIAEKSEFLLFSAFPYQTGSKKV